MHITNTFRSHGNFVFITIHQCGAVPLWRPDVCHLFSNCQILDPAATLFALLILNH